MGVHVHRGTMVGALTPICNACNISLCWDIGEDQYEQDKQFWDNWTCQDCNGGQKLSRKQWRETQ
jgi:hypothetical protein